MRMSQTGPAAGVGALLLALGACAPMDAPGGGVSIEFEKYELANGLDVILHVDRSDLIAAVAMTFHVGSAREVEGKTGFAHLFEHLFFLDSENLGPGGLDRLMTRVGSPRSPLQTVEEICSSRASTPRHSPAPSSAWGTRCASMPETRSR